MNNDVTLTMGNQGDGEQFVQVPIKKKDFGDFITNLLGQPEIIRDRKIGTFDTNLEWFIHVHHLLDQKIKSQSHASLVDFSAVFNYRNAPERKLTSIDAFLHFSEAKIVRTKGVTLTWTYLVEFPNKPVPEKQEIRLTLLAERTQVVHIGGTGLTKQTTSTNGVASYEISHTQRTWGDDIQTIIDREVDSIFIEKTKSERLFQPIVMFLAFAIFIAGFIAPEYIQQIIAEKQLAALFADYVKDGMQIQDLAIDDKLSLILGIVDPSNDLAVKNSWYQVVSVIGGMILAGITLAIFEKEQPSFITVTNKDKQYRKSCIASSKSSFIKKVASIFVAIATSVAANYVYLYLST
ncbi:TPA: hypothetical protein KD866_004765 [Vibrio parahaemolyticus]|nr:hypothetical protein [Vibrio parahaemolyticus]